MNNQAEQQEGEPEGGKGQARYYHLLRLHLSIGEVGKGIGEQVVECKKGGEDAGADEDVLEESEVGRVGPVDSRAGQEGEGKREKPDKFLGLGQWGGGEG